VFRWCWVYCIVDYGSSNTSINCSGATRKAVHILMHTQILSVSSGGALRVISLIQQYGCKSYMQHTLMRFEYALSFVISKQLCIAVLDSTEVC
jgi:hypothetical protein